MEITALTLGEELALKRKRESKTQTELSAELKIGRTQLSLVESGRLQPTDKQRKIIEAYLNAE